MKLCAIIVLFVCSAFIEDFRLLRERPVNRRSIRHSRLYRFFHKHPVDTHAIIAAAAKKHNVPPAFVKSIMAAESGFDCDAVSPKGAIGLMQVMPETAQQFGDDPTDPVQNVDAGTRYLRVLMNKYGTSRRRLRRVIAAYNAGPGAVDRYRGIPPYRETRTYVTRVLAYLRQYGKERG